MFWQACLAELSDAFDCRLIRLFKVSRERINAVRLMGTPLQLRTDSIDFFPDGAMCMQNEKAEAETQGNEMNVRASFLTGL